MLTRRRLIKHALLLSATACTPFLALSQQQKKHLKNIFSDSTLKTKIQQDFRDGRYQAIDGWYLSDTEIQHIKQPSIDV